MAHQQGGYENEFVETVQERYICRICTNPLREPYLAVCCGQHFCHSCLSSWFEKNNSQVCPHCRETDDFNHVIDKKLKREILDMKVKCSKHQEGCEWIGELRGLNEHLESSSGCGYVEVECPKECTMIVSWKEPQTHKTITMKRKDVQNHLETECCNREYECEYCRKQDTYIEITGKGMNFDRQEQECHYYQCPEIPEKCPNDCGADKIKRKNISIHRNKCPLEIIYCSNKCKTKAKLYSGAEKETDIKMERQKLEKHLKDECYLRPYKCEHCNLESTYLAITGNGVWKQPKSHYDTCMEFPLPCPNGCGQDQVKRRNMKVHRSTCPEEIVQCPNKCSHFPKGMKQKHLSEHVTSECPLRQYTCKHCGTQDTYTAITEHYKSCAKYPLECPNQCGAEGITRDSVNLHCNICPLQPVECPFAEAGCKAELLRQDLVKHGTEMQQKHLQMMMASFKQMKQEHQEELRKTREELRKTNGELKQTKEELEQTQEKVSNMETSISSIRDNRYQRGNRGRGYHVRSRGRHNQGYESDTSNWRHPH